MGIINNQSKASWNDFLRCRKSYGVCISFRKLSSECVMHIAHTATSLQYYFPTRNRAIDWKLLIAGKENLDYLCVNNFLIK